MSGSPCAGTFIFSPSGGPLARAYIAARARGGPPRGGGMTAPGPARAAAPTAAPAAAPARAARPRFAYTPGAPRPPYHRRSRLGAGWGAGAEGGGGWGGGSARPPRGWDAERREVLPNSVRGRVARRGDLGQGRLRIGAEFAALSASRPWDGGGRGMVCRGSAPSELRGSHPVSVTWLLARSSLPKELSLGTGGRGQGLREAECAEEKQSRLKVNWDIPSIHYNHK